MASITKTFLIVDPVRYSTALGDDGLALLRRAGDDRSATPDPDFAVRYTQERLAVLDGDVDRIVELLGGDLTGTYQFIRVAEAMVELGRVDDALAWAREASSRRTVGRSPSSTTSQPM